MIISAKDLASRLGDKKNSLKDRNLPRAPKKEGRTENDLDRNDHQAGPDLFIRDARPCSRPGDVTIPDEVKIPAMVLARLDAGTQDEIAEMFGISQDSVSRAERGINTTEHQESVVDGALRGIREEVINKLDESLSFLTPDKFANAKLGELSNAIGRLAAVQETLSPVRKDSAVTNVKVVIHAVGRQEINHYETIEVGS